MKILLLLMTVFIGVSLQSSQAQEMKADQMGNDSTLGQSGCGHMEVWDFPNGMCLPLAMKGMPMKMVMFHYNSFFTQTVEEGRRGRNAFSVPNIFMLDAGSSVGDRHYLNVELMGTFERWTFPENGTPELLQIGEANSSHVPYLDAQHPHSSPIMGLTLSDTISLGGGKDYIKIVFAPRGQSTDGPVAFMHRPTGMENPDAPLGHHIGQDVGHISSTVVGGALRLSETTVELSTFSGSEPEPSKVDLPMYKPNSYAARFTQVFSPHLYAMASAAFVKNPEPHDPELDHIWRYSASLYNDLPLESGWRFNNAFIWGLINDYDSASALNSFAEEFGFFRDKKSIWGRVEVLQRTPEELEIRSLAPSDPKWVTAVTIGYTHKIATWDMADVGIGASLTKDLLPAEFQSAYSGDPLSGKIFIQVGGMRMWNF